MSLPEVVCQEQMQPPLVFYEIRYGRGREGGCIRHEREAHNFLLLEIYKVWNFASISCISVRSNSPVGGYFGCYVLHPFVCQWYE